MAAYAAATSLMGTIRLISQSRLDIQEDHKEHLKLLYDKVRSLLEYLDINPDDEQMKDLLKKVNDLAQQVEDKVESHIQGEAQNTLLKMLPRVLHLPTLANTMLLKIFQRAIEEIDNLKKELIKLRENNSMGAGNCSLGDSTSPQSHVSTLENDMVGYDSEREHMVDQIRGHSYELEVISIAGMGGIGKSTFAKRMYSDPSIVKFFDVRGWITVSKDYSIRKMLLSLLQDAIGVKEELHKKSDEELAKALKITDGELEDRLLKIDGELADRLRKSLMGRRYLIVVDDIWSMEAWDEIRRWFPGNSNKSRILLTTRDMNVAQYASSRGNPFLMRFLEPEESWNLFCRKAFGKQDFPIEFENVAKVVVENCKGLPLMISVVAGTLSSKRTLDEWRKVALSVSTFVNLDDYQRCSGVLALSYNHLPSHLKACFLYFGVFPKASEISVKKLIRLWVAEGLLEIKGPEGLEKLGTNLFHDLIDKSLIVVRKRNLDGKIKTCRIHDLLHDLCLREAESKRMLYVVNDTTHEGPGRDFPRGLKWVSFHTTGGYQPVIFNDPTHRKTRSLHFYANLSYRLQLVHFKLLRVLDLEAMNFHSFPSDISRLVCLRYLVMKIYVISEDFFNLRNLQTLIIRLYSTRGIYLPNEIWDMSQLRHLHFSRMFLNSPRKVSSNAGIRSLENLQSVSGLDPSCCTEEVFQGLKKVKKLGISGTVNRRSQGLDNLKYLHELEALKIFKLLWLPRSDSFPPNLKKLTLRETYLEWEDMTIISKLPKLEVLQLKDSAFGGKWTSEGAVWEVNEMGFPELKFLLLNELHLDYWRASDDSFPRLEIIIIRSCRKLKEIPEGFVGSMTLQLIELHKCSPSLVNCVEQIQNEQLESCGSDTLKVYAFDTIKDSDAVPAMENFSEEY